MAELIVFFIGLFVGSFLNVIIDRLPRSEGVFLGRSHCDFCKHTLAWYDLIPLFSFLFLGGKCRYCHRFIGWKYPLIEITTGILFAETILIIGITSLSTFIITLLILCCLTSVFYTDLFSGIIPDTVLVFLGICALVKIYATHQSVVYFLYAALGSFVLFLLLYLFTRGKGMGFGDVKYAFVMGLLLGFPEIILGLYIAFLTGAGIALILVMVKKKSFASSVPFGPFLVVGTIVNIFWGMQVWILFQKLLGI